MKYPALVRVFSLVLAIMAVIMIAVGAFALKDAVTDNKENTRVYELLVSRTEELKETKELLSDGEDPEELEAELERLEAAHEKDKSLHLMNLGTYTATKSGLAQADTMILEQIEAMVPGLDINDYTMETLTGLAPLLVWLYPELQDAANNLQATVGTYTASVKDASAQLRNFTELAGTAAYLNEEQITAVAKQYGIEDENLVKSIISAAVNSGNSAAGKIDSAADQALNYAKSLMNTVDSYDGTVYTIEQYIPQLVQLQDSKQGLTETKTDLVNSKTKLDKETAEIDEVSAELEELQALQKKESSLTVLLKTNSNIKEKVQKGGDILTVAEAECESMEKSNRKLYRGELLTGILMIMAGLCALAGLPAAYEKIASRVMLILPAVLFTVLSGAAELLTELNKGERQYAAIVAGILGILYLLIALPRNKTDELED